MRVGKLKQQRLDAVREDLESPVAIAARRRAWLAFAWFVVGIVIARLVIPRIGVADDTPVDVLAGVAFACTILCGAGALIVPRLLVRPVLCVSLVLLGASCYLVRTTPADTVLSRQSGEGNASEPMLVTVEGRAREIIQARTIEEDDPEHYLFFTPRSGVRLRAEAVIADGQRHPLGGKLTVWGDGLDAGVIRTGDRLRVTGWFTPVRDAKNPGEADHRLYGAQDGALGSLSIEQPRNIVVLGHDPNLADGMRARALGVLGRAVRPDDARSHSGTTLEMLLLGMDGRGSAELRTSFAEVGASHLLAISGFHLAVLAGCVLFTLRAMGDFRGLELVCVLVLIGAAMVVLPVRSSIVRSGVMVIVILGAELLGRRYDTLTLLAWIAMGLLVWRPLELFGLGFQLTIGITALLLWMSGVFHPWVVDPFEVRTAEQHRGTMWQRVRTSLRGYIAVCTVAVLVASPVVVYHTGVLSLLAPVNTALITPLVVVVLVMGYGALLLAAVAPALSDIGAFVATGFCEWLLASVGLMENIPCTTLHLPRVSLVWALAAVAASLYFVRLADLRAWRGWLALVLVWGWLCVEVMVAPRLSGSVGALRVDALHVGNGSCLLVRSGGDALLWDCGSLRAGLGERTIPRAFRDLGAGKIRQAIITHDNIDHYGALPSCAERLGIERVYISAPALASMRTRRRGAAPTFLDALEGMGIEVLPIGAGDAVRIGSTSAEILWPPLPSSSDQAQRGVTRSNDMSVVARISVETGEGTRSALLCGDIQQAPMLSLMETGPIDADILELPHHGSWHSVAPAFVDAVDPSVVLQSTGTSRLDDPRWGPWRRRIGEKRDGAWLVTARDGASWASVSRSGEIRSGSVRP